MVDDGIADAPKCDSTVVPAVSSLLRVWLNKKHLQQNGSVV